MNTEWKNLSFWVSARHVEIFKNQLATGILVRVPNNATYILKLNPKLDHINFKAKYNFVPGREYNLLKFTNDQRRALLRMIG
jgi:hypothetical protein